MGNSIVLQDDPKYYSFAFSAYGEPILRINPGDHLEVHSPDTMQGTIRNKSDVFSECTKHIKYFNPCIGPIYVEGAEPGDVLVVHILDVRPDRDYAVSCIQSDFGGLVGNKNNAAVLNPLYQEHTYIWQLCDQGTMFYEEELDIKIPAKPFLGCIGVAPDIGALSTEVPYWHGGNMDVPCACAGNTMYFKVTCQGAYFFCGDCHGMQGQGELCGQGLEMPGEIHLEFDVIKSKEMMWPRCESRDQIMAIGSGRPMEEAAKMANMELIRWMQQDFGFTECDAYQLLTQVGGLYVGNCCDPYYSLVASIDKKYLVRAFN